jgi:hypothetical protein
MSDKHLCDAMAECGRLSDRVVDIYRDDDGWWLFVGSPHDGENVLVKFCPFCGAKL